jgi:hypothetical protein
VPNGLVAKQIAVGYKHSCALKIDGTVECWGNDEHGETTVSNGLVAKQVAAGEGFSFDLKMDNNVECWGDNNSEKTTVPNGLVAKQIALGSSHACAIKLDDTPIFKAQVCLYPTAICLATSPFGTVLPQHSTLPSNVKAHWWL